MMHNTNFMMKNNKNMRRKYMKALVDIFYELAPLTDVISSKLQIDGENILVSFCQNTLHLSE